jgi:AcrR family transcriptional regulator
MLAADKATGSGLKAEISDFKRRRIREEASHLFFERGYESTTIDAIAQQLDVTKPFIYSYYSNKSELLYDICRTGITLSLEAIDRATSGERSASERLRHLVELVLRIIFDYQEYIVVYEREEKNLDPKQARDIRELRKLFDHKLATILEQGHAAGEFEIHDALLTATTIGGMITWVSFWYSPTGKRSEHDIVTHIMDMVDAVVRQSAKPEIQVA